MAAATPVTQKDIAARLGISQQQVAKSLIGRKGASPASRARVLAAAKELGYATNMAAQALRCGTSKIVVFASLESCPAWLISPPFLEALSSQGYKLEVKNARDNPGLLHTLEQIINSRSADAFVLSGCRADIEQQAALLEAMNQPFIAHGYSDDSRQQWSQIDWDHRGMMRQTVDKLVELGHERIALLSHSNDEVYARRFRDAFDERIRERFNRTTPEEWLLLHNETVNDLDRLMRRIAQWQRLPIDERPTAIAIGEVGSVMHMIEIALLGYGIKVGDAPGRFAIAGQMIGLGRSAVVVSGATWAYDQSADHELLSRMIDNHLIPLLRREQPRERIVRYLPALVRYAARIDVWSLGAITATPNR